MEEGPPEEEARAREAQGRGARGGTQIDDDYTILGIEHVHITAPSELLEETIEWYRSCLRLEPVEKPEGTRPDGAWFGAGPQELHISVDEHNPPKVSHFALVFDAYEPVIESLREQGCHIEQAATIPGRHRCYTRDPAGNRVEIVHYDEVEVVALETARGELRAKVMHEER